ncbi:MAG: hypothetical protein ACYTGW_23190 [Planctomycetota bacterium]
MTAQLDMQDVVALALAAAGLVLAWWLHYRLAKPARCARCSLRPADE